MLQDGRKLFALELDLINLVVGVWAGVYWDVVEAE